MSDVELDGFLIVAQRGSITLAAQELGLTQSGLSRQLQRLERRLGILLFERTRGGVRLTPAGERYRAYAEDVVTRRRRLLEELRGEATATPLGGELRIAASTTPGEFLVPRLVAEFTARYPGVRPVVFTTDSRAVIDCVAERQWDIGFVGAQLAAKGVRFDPVATDEVVLAVPAGHPLAQHAAVPLEALAGQDFVEREGGSGTLLSVRQALAARGLTLPPYRVRMTLSTTHAIVSAVRSGYGIGFVSSLALAEPLDRRVVAVRLAGVPLERRLYLVRHARDVLPAQARRFVEFALAKRRTTNDE
ncbi:MAG: LysR family transcriptional regulator [Chloroflexi bacterium]|nr:LysR family transcriptional regulator [Chloroflexota bacterium]